MKIYTCFGDKGKTKLISGEIVDKNDKLIVAYGNVDKLIAFLGFIISFYKEFYSYIIKNKYK
ncbi:MAG: ATP:cob(I)alamin adenosyltransferase, partial [Candidatus Methanomethylicia archaeon]